MTKTIEDIKKHMQGAMLLYGDCVTNKDCHEYDDFYITLEQQIIELLDGMPICEPMEGVSLYHNRICKKVMKEYDVPNEYISAFHGLAHLMIKDGNEYLDTIEQWHKNVISK